MRLGSDSIVPSSARRRKRLAVSHGQPSAFAGPVTDAHADLLTVVVCVRDLVADPRAWLIVGVKGANSPVTPRLREGWEDRRPWPSVSLPRVQGLLGALVRCRRGLDVK